MRVSILKVTTEATSTNAELGNRRRHLLVTARACMAQFFRLFLFNTYTHTHTRTHARTHTGVVGKPVDEDAVEAAEEGGPSAWKRRKTTQERKAEQVEVRGWVGGGWVGGGGRGGLGRGRRWVGGMRGWAGGKRAGDTGECRGAGMV